MMRTLASGALFGALLLMASSAPASADPSPKSEAQIAVTFSADCTAFTVASTKDISYVEVSFIDGAVSKDESMRSPTYDRTGTTVITQVAVKSGTTLRSFACVAEGEPDHGQD
jgi:hypothetical protein